jgi:hypothetical protein
MMTFERTEAWLDRAERFLVLIVAKIGPWTAPLPTAWIVWDRTVALLGWPWWVGLFAAVTLEALGLVTAFVALDLYGWNRTKRKSDPAAPLWLAVVLIGVYLFVAELLTVLLDIASKPVTVVSLAPGAFPFLTLAGVALIALRVDQGQREREVAESRQKAREDRVSSRSANSEQSVRLEGRALALRERFGDGVSFTRADAQAALGGVSQTTAGLVIRDLTDRGLLAKSEGRVPVYAFGRNGHKG